MLCIPFQFPFCGGNPPGDRASLFPARLSMSGRNFNNAETQLTDIHNLTHLAVGHVLGRARGLLSAMRRRNDHVCTQIEDDKGAPFTSYCSHS